MNANKLKKKAALSALQYIHPKHILGVGTGSTIFYFIEALNKIKNIISGVVSSSKNSTLLLKKHGVRVLELKKFYEIDIYVDSADEINNQMQMIKGRGAALTREKIIASMAKKFICVIDQSKYVNVLGSCPLPIEIIPSSYSYILHEIIKIGGKPKIRNNVVTDNGNIIIDVHDLSIQDPILVENKINAIPGVVTVGLFASRPADMILIGTNNGVKKIIK